MTATLLNNHASSLFSLNKKGRAKNGFERALLTLQSTVGASHARSDLVSRNLKLVKQNQTSLSSDYASSLSLRPDKDKLIAGQFVINAIAPGGGGGGKKGKKGKKGGKKGKKKK